MRFHHDFEHLLRGCHLKGYGRFKRRGLWRRYGDVGLLLPCNVIVYETDDQKTCVCAINPVSALQVIKNSELRKIAEEVSEKLKRVIDKVAKSR